MATQTKQFGGWYKNPATGQVQRYWGGDVWTDGSDPTQGLGENWQSLLANKTSASSTSTSTGNPLNDVNKTIEDSFQKLQNEVVAKYGDYKAGHPFKLDELLAAKNVEAKEQIDPYYNELLGDYLTGVQRKIDRGTNDTKDLLTELTANKDTYTKQSQQVLDESVNKAEEGFADSGMFGSGQALRQEGLMKTDANNAMADYTRKSDNQVNQLKTGLNRNLEDIGLEKKGYVRDLERNRFTDVSQRASDLTKEAGQQYIQGFQSTLPPQLQASSGFDLLKDLGIYS
jgi:hypothetical protein